MKQDHHALVVLSGGQDSVTCLGIALDTYERVSAISFHYNQRHKVELKCAADVCFKYGVPHRIVYMADLLTSLVTSALTGVGEVGLPHAHKPGLPSSFVPGRNALFLTLAHAHAQEIKASRIITGVCETDFSGYPDCRHMFIMAMEQALNIGYETDIAIITPLMFVDKAATFALARQHRFLDVVLEHSHTCYNGDHEHRHAWGYGCGECPACKLRKDGWEKFQLNTLGIPGEL